MRVALIGLGLIGGSIAGALREHAGASVAGFDPDPSALDLGLARGLLDHGCATAAEALEGAQAAFVAAPVRTLVRTVGEVLEAAPEDCVVTDVGSLKRAIVAAHEDHRFVGGHPLAGSEHAGAGYARADMFAGATWYLTPGPNTSKDLYERLRGLLEAIGARPRAIEPHTHDAVVATVSQLPHVLAGALAAQALAELPEADAARWSAGPSFRDATRVAGAPSEMWTDIYAANADLLAATLGGLTQRLDEFRAALLDGDRARIAAFAEAAQAARARLTGDPR
jgi:prephenate dehydrogenase